MKIKSLNGAWKFSYLPHEEVAKQNFPIKQWKDIVEYGFPMLESKVPGTIENALLDAGIIEDPYFDTNIIENQKWELFDYWFSKDFKIENSKVDNYLVFNGVDTIADVYVDGNKLSELDNMLIEHAVPLKNISTGTHEIFVHIKPVVIEARKYRYAAGEGAFKYNHESLHIRKAAHMFGWDISPRLVSGGIWKDVDIVEMPEQYIKELYFFTKEISEDYTCANLSLYYDAEVTDVNIHKYKLKIDISCKEQQESFETELWFSSGVYRFDVKNPYLWWTKDKGEPNLYNAEVTLIYENKVIDKRSTRFGIRTVDLEYRHLTETDNGKFCFILNGKKIFIRGTNWVPADAIHSNDKNRVLDIINLVDDIGCNAIRCWGGNVYEDHIFFDACDEKGILVWQDFAMACATYPQDEDFCERMQKEVRSVVKKLRQHPSLMVWAGDNECDWGIYRGWYDVKGNPNHNKITREIIPDVLQAEDPWRPYLPSSPYADDYVIENKLDETVEDHIWGPRDYYKGKFYTTNRATFASEIGYHGCVSPESVQKFIKKDKIWPPLNNNSWLAHATSPEINTTTGYAYRIPLMCNQVKNLFGEMPDNFTEFAIASQISQAEAMKFFIERFRMAKWDKTGIIWWNIMDCWPQFSDSVVDYYFNRKQAYFHIKQSQQKFCIMISEKCSNETRNVVAVNDTNKAIEFEYEILDALTDKIVCEGSSKIGCDSAKVVCSMPPDLYEKGMYYIKWKYGETNGYNHYLYGNPTFSLQECLKWFNKYGIIKADGFSEC